MRTRTKWNEYVQTAKRRFSQSDGILSSALHIVKIVPKLCSYLRLCNSWNKQQKNKTMEEHNVIVD